MKLINRKYNRDIIGLAEEEIYNLEDMIKKIDRYLDNAPNGSLKCHRKEGQTYYYHRYMIKNENDETTKWKSDYIKKKSPLITQLANKQYYSDLKPILTKNLNELKRFASKYKIEQADNVFEALSEDRKNLVTPLQLSSREQVRLWNEEKYVKNNMYPENLRYETDKGDLVRSKSEVIIANYLFKQNNKISYKYERPLEIMVDGMIRIVYPDFTILNLKTGRIFLWEHAGRMDDPHYANEFVKKINSYVSNGLMIGTDVIITYETQGIPLDIGVMKTLAKQIIGRA